MHAIRQFIWYWLPPLAWMGMIFVLSAQPDLPRPPGPLLQTLYEKGGHALTYAVLAWLYLRALRGRLRVSTVLRLVSAGLAMLYAWSDEYHQAFVPGRSCDPWDWVTDSVGACGAMLLSWWLERRRSLRQPESGCPIPDRQSPAR